jgi:photosystem II stability/assembly factor-like uncharacterized protein
MRRLPLFLLIFIPLVVISAPGAQEELTWKPQASGVLAKLSSVFFLNERQGWVAGSGGTLLATDDGGEKWRRIALPERESKETINDIWFFNQSQGCLLGEYSLYNRKSGINSSERIFSLTSSDAGAKWVASELAEQPLPVRSGLSGRSVPAGRSEPKPLEKEGEAGQQPDAVLVRMAFANPKVGWACGETGAIQTTTDGGTSWQMQYPMTKKLLYDVAAIDENRAVIVGAGGTILQTRDGGRNWTASISGVTQSLRAVHFVDSKRGWAVGSSGVVIYTENGGSNWKQQKSEVTGSLNDVFFFNTKEGWAAGDRGLLLHTTDGGTTWESVQIDTHSNLARLNFVSPGCGWVVGSSGTIFKYGK